MTKPSSTLAPAAAPSVSWRRFVDLGVMGVVGLAALVLSIRVFARSVRGITLDQRLMDSLGSSPRATAAVYDALGTVSVVTVAIVSGLCFLAALVRGRRAAAFAAIVLVGGANETTQILKWRVIQRPLGYGVNTLPSGHTTVALSLALAAIIVAPLAWRAIVVPVAAFGATFVGAGTVVGHWHRPGDVLAAIAVCLVWAAIAIAIVTYAQSRRPQPTPPIGAHWLSFLGACVAGLLFVSLGIRPSAGDVNLPLAVMALGPLGLAEAICVGWTSRATDRRVA